MKRTLQSLGVSRYRPAMALMVTMGIMALIAVSILGTLKLIDSSMQHTKQAQAFNQDQAILKSVMQLLLKEGQKIDSATALDAFLVTIPTIKDDKGSLELRVVLSSLQGKININAMFDDDNKTLAPHYETMFHRLCDRYEVKNPDILLAMIADTIDSDNIERYSESELVNRYADMAQGGIFSTSQLRKLLAYYDAMYEDSSVYEIPWEKFFRYGRSYEKGILDCNHIPSELAVYTGLQLSATGLETIRCDQITKEDNRTKSDFGMHPFSMDQPYHVQVDVGYKTATLEGKFSMIYEIKNKEISYIKSY